MTSILITDDDQRLRQGLRTLLEGHPGWRVVGEAANGREALEKAVQLAPEVVILDISMPELDGIGAARLIREALPQAEMLMFSQHDASDIVARAIDAGVRGYVLKSRASRDLIPAVEAVSRHGSFLSAEISAVRPGLEAKNEASAGACAGPSKNKISD
jgi:DNA-binding NarL/FixJ family response regulator